jgi:hypothetical protein
MQEQNDRIIHLREFAVEILTLSPYRRNGFLNEIVLNLQQHRTRDLNQNVCTTKWVSHFRLQRLSVAMPLLYSISTSTTLTERSSHNVRLREFCFGDAVHQPAFADRFIWKRISTNRSMFGSVVRWVLLKNLIFLSNTMQMSSADIKSIEKIFRSICRIYHSSQP